MMSVDIPAQTTRPVPPGPDRWLERARALAPIIGEWRGAAERTGQLPQPLLDALREAGLFGMAAASEVGGAAVRDERLLEVIEELARRDASVAWNVVIGAHAAVMASYLPPSTLRAAYRRGPNAAFAGSLLPKGVARRVAGGFCVSGRWPFASGCRHADWWFTPGVVMTDGSPEIRPDGQPDMRAFCVPPAAGEVLETWDTAGLRGTGSHDVQLAEVLVPEEWSFPIQLDGPARAGVLTLGHFLPYAQPYIAAVALGIARDAIDAFAALAVAKTPLFSNGALATQHTIQERVGRAEALLGSARAFLYESVRELPSSPTWSTPVDDALNARVRLASAHAAQSAAEAVDLMFTAAGTSSIFTGSRLERCFRDIHVVTQHAAVAPSHIEMVGQFVLGLGLHVRR
jgi:alkylation response protein AidB-like acyl-CoA dehydrogenase